MTQYCELQKKFLIVSVGHINLEHIKMGTFGEKGPFFGAKKWHYGCLKNNYETTFRSPTSPKNDGIAFCLRCLPLLDGFSAILKFCTFSAL